ncbi:hypothetical protein LINPERHAP1_LOCUS4964 [Linum perenne]
MLDGRLSCRFVRSLECRVPKTWGDTWEFQLFMAEIRSICTGTWWSVSRLSWLAGKLAHFPLRDGCPLLYPPLIPFPRIRCRRSCCPMRFVMPLTRRLEALFGARLTGSVRCTL